MPGIDFRAVRAVVGISDVLALLGWRPRRWRGDQWRGPCPLHGSRSPTSRCFAVHRGKNVYHWFGCGAAGNALELYAAVTHQSLFPAAVELCGRLGHAVPWLKPTRQPPEEPPTMPSL
jgi:DNA primase